jgi:tetratricopeptide (TPR) repeat protein
LNRHDTAVFAQPGAVLLPRRESPRTLTVDALAALLPDHSTLFILRCDFDEGGPWAGTRDFFRTLLPDLRSQAAELLARHDYELVHVLPELKPVLGIRNPTLTDLASHEERVRNYPSDRALRIVHGLIDLLLSFKGGGERAAWTWVLLCLDYDRAGHMSQVFLRELMRRAGRKLRFLLVPLCPGRPEPAFPPVLVCRALPFDIEAPGGREDPGPAAAGELAKAVESQVGEDTLMSTVTIPELIWLWTRAEHPYKVFEWQYKALHAFNTLGLYEDAIRYGERARQYCKGAGLYLPRGGWGIFFKLVMSYLGIGAPETAQQLAEEDVPAGAEIADGAMGIRFCYLMAMLHARYLPVRDYALAERYLELGLTHLEKAALPESEHYFQLAFNRNGLAMIRSFQERYQEALELCRLGWQLLDEHLDPGKHRLHRSVLLYNMAQVYSRTGSFTLAIDHYTAAMRLDPNYSEYFNERGNLLLKLGRLVEADSDYSQAIALGPPYFEVWTNLGHCRRLQGRLEEALDAYERSLDLRPDQPMVWLVRAQVLEAAGRPGEAIVAYGRAVALLPTLWQAFAGRAVLLYERGEVSASLLDLDRAAALAPAEPEIYQNRAVAHGDLGRHEDACRDLRRYLELRPDAADRVEVEARLCALSSTPATMPHGETR